jgi:hypothetical protein
VIDLHADAQSLRASSPRWGQCMPAFDAKSFEAAIKAATG